MIPGFLTCKIECALAHSRAEARLLQQPSTFAPSTHPRGAFLYDRAQFPIIWCWGQKLLTPLIPDCSALRAPAILKTFVIRSFFFEKRLLTHVFGGSQGQKFSCKQACVELLTFWPWYHAYNISTNGGICQLNIWQSTAMIYFRGMA